MTEVAVLGCGPAGLLVAHAVEQAGHEPIIYSRKEKSVIPGSLHVQEHIPGITSPYPDFNAQFVRLGTREVYARKVYGDPERETGWSNYNTLYRSWNAVQMYDSLWIRYNDRIQDRNISPGMIVDLCDVFPMVISTLPQKNLCQMNHVFDSVKYWIVTLPTPEEDQGREVLVFNGLPGDDWYRWTILGGITSIEYTIQPRGYPAEQVREGVKALGNNCDCFPRMHRAGRWAEWKHGVLLQHAYRKAVELVKEL